MKNTWWGVIALLITLVATICLVALIMVYGDRLVRYLEDGEGGGE